MKKYFDLIDEYQSEYYFENLLELAEKYDDIEIKEDLAICYENGDGTNENPLEAIYWYKEMAKQLLPESNADLESQDRNSQFTIKESAATEIEFILDKIYELSSKIENK